MSVDGVVIIAPNFSSRFSAIYCSVGNKRCPSCTIYKVKYLGKPFFDDLRIILANM